MIYRVDGERDSTWIDTYFQRKGSTVAQYTGQTLYKKVLESKYFETKDYAKALTDAFLSLDKSLLEGTIRGTRTVKRKD